MLRDIHIAVFMCKIIASIICQQAWETMIVCR